MLRLNKIFLYLLSLLLLASLLPWFFHYVADKPNYQPFTLYSGMTKSFAMIEWGEKGVEYYDSKGQHFSENQFDSILPTFYYRMLASENRLPDSLYGIPVAIEDYQREMFIFRSNPSAINQYKVKLYPLLESIPRRLDLEMPDDVFRLRSEGIEFVDIKTNSVKEKKTTKFQRLMAKRDVEFPIQMISGNPTSQKPYDLGYFFVDANNQLFHLKQTYGNPFLRKVDVNPEIEIAQIFITEYEGRRSYAFITDVNNNFYVLTSPDYLLKKVEIGSFNANKDALMIIGNQFDWTVQKLVADSTTYYAIDAEKYSLIDLYPVLQAKEETVADWAQYIFPFQLSFKSYLDKKVYPRINKVSWKVIYLNIFFLCVYLLFLRFFSHSKPSNRMLFFSSLSLLFFGVYAFFILFLFGNLYPKNCF